MLSDACAGLPINNDDLMGEHFLVVQSDILDAEQEGEQETTKSKKAPLWEGPNEIMESPEMAEYFDKAITPCLNPISQLQKQIVAKFASYGIQEPPIKSIIKINVRHICKQMLTVASAA